VKKREQSHGDTVKKKVERKKKIRVTSTKGDQKKGQGGKPRGDAHFEGKEKKKVTSFFFHEGNSPHSCYHPDPFCSRHIR